MFISGYITIYRCQFTGALKWVTLHMMHGYVWMVEDCFGWDNFSCQPTGFTVYLYGAYLGPHLISSAPFNSIFIRTLKLKLILQSYWMFTHHWVKYEKWRLRYYYILIKLDQGIRIIWGSLFFIVWPNLVHKDLSCGRFILLLLGSFSDDVDAWLLVRQNGPMMHVLPLKSIWDGNGFIKSSFFFFRMRLWVH